MANVHAEYGYIQPIDLKKMLYAIYFCKEDAQNPAAEHLA